MDSSNLTASLLAIVSAAASGSFIAWITNTLKHRADRPHEAAEAIGNIFKGYEGLVEQFNKRMDDLQDEVDKIPALHQRIDDLQSDKDKLRVEFDVQGDQFREELDLLRKRNREITSRAEVLTAEVNRLTTRETELTAENTELRQRLGECTTELESLRRVVGIISLTNENGKESGD